MLHKLSGITIIWASTHNLCLKLIRKPHLWSIWIFDKVAKQGKQGKKSFTLIYLFRKNYMKYHLTAYIIPGKFFWQGKNMGRLILDGWSLIQPLWRLKLQQCSLLHQCAWFWYMPSARNNTIDILFRYPSAFVNSMEVSYKASFAVLTLNLAWESHRGRGVKIGRGSTSAIFLKLLDPFIFISKKRMSLWKNKSCLDIC